jgi:hypothetical protein
MKVNRLTSRLLLCVAGTLPFGATADVEREVDYILDYTGGRRACLFTSNVTTVETPPANLVAAYRHAQQADLRHRHRAPRPWPWSTKTRTTC